MRRTDVIVIGAGAAGLSAAAALKRRGIEPILLDRDHQIGGTWARRYERLHLHTIRRFSGLAHHAIPRAYPRYLSKDMYAQYLRDSAAALELEVLLNRDVRSLRRIDGGWEAATEDGEKLGATVAIIATGSYNKPLLPDWVGLGSFAGRVVHSRDYVSGRDYAGQAVLVVGIGNSGAEIAADLVEQGAARVSIAVRTPPPIMPRDLFGILPVQLLGIAFTPIPAPRLIDRMGAATRRAALGDLGAYGLGKAGWGPFTARRPAVIDVGFLKQLKARRVAVRPAVERLTVTGAVFTDGSEEDFTAVVAATGFTTGLAGMLDVPDALRENGRPRVRSGRRTPYPGLYFMGFDETTRGVLFEARRDSKRLARDVRRYLSETPTPG